MNVQEVVKNVHGGRLRKEIRKKFYSQKLEDYNSFISEFSKNVEKVCENSLYSVKKEDSFYEVSLSEAIVKELEVAHSMPPREFRFGKYFMRVSEKGLTEE